MSFNSFCAGIALIGVGWMTMLALESKDTYYPIPLDQVNKTIDQAGLPELVLGFRASKTKHWRVNPTTSMWAIQGDGNLELLRFSATTIAHGDGTRVSYNVLPPEGPTRDKVAQALKDNGSIRDLYKSALAEQIDSKLNNREYNYANLSRAGARAAIAVLPQVKESMQNSESSWDRQARERIDRAYANENRR